MEIIRHILNICPGGTTISGKSIFGFYLTRKINFYLFRIQDTPLSCTICQKLHEINGDDLGNHIIKDFPKMWFNMSCDNYTKAKGRPSSRAPWQDPRLLQKV